MQYKCEVCHDSGSKNQTGDYLDCPACDMPHTRKALNDFVKSLGPTHPEDVALAIHQRALAMAPKQEAQEPVAWRVRDGVDPLPPPEPLYAVPVAANGALPELPKPETMIVESDIGHRAYTADQMRAYSQACAAAGPDAALVALIHKAQSILAQHLPPDGPDAKTTISELLGLLDGPESRAALSGAKGN